MSTDSVNHPAHYTAHPSGVECIAITEWMNFCVGNAVKYLWRADSKGNALEDLRKAAWYVQREIDRRLGQANAEAHGAYEKGTCSCGANVGDLGGWEIHRREMTEAMAAQGVTAIPAPAYSYPAMLVREFHEAFGAVIGSPMLPEVIELRVRLLKEEAKEATKALKAGDLTASAKELADLVYVAYGAALAFGIDLDAAVQSVHDSNMTKLGTDGRPLLREDGKVLKGPNYQEADVSAALPDNVRACLTYDQIDVTPLGKPPGTVFLRGMSILQRAAELAHYNNARGMARYFTRAHQAHEEHGGCPAAPGAACGYESLAQHYIDENA